MNLLRTSVIVRERLQFLLFSVPSRLLFRHRRSLDTVPRTKYLWISTSFCSRSSRGLPSNPFCGHLYTSFLHTLGFLGHDSMVL
ncbi:hypothetical protein BEWA_021390 [Theileria equi strain WA]|uniref:Uncharacterized protein n=1 Tax=Theileria equi strain WA TaxID=1537102 RepID=L0AW86_THEEQ|nr:hypothetical protein BEWA_021390 [Theileria equi strain WA]AFZ79291.1 hypothetical protein BEWA_021390 [Theileria equi strain WA]|eukprot:XP_004828957.1 hypothetical protein BEWA_021390 [Theileria equi strain WA]